MNKSLKCLNCRTGQSHTGISLCKRELCAYLSAVDRSLLPVVKATILLCDHASVTRNEWRL